MRVISGSARGSKLYTLEGNTTRPTLDRVKEALFNIIQGNLVDAEVLDLFAGSGNLGIEALSRGANSCTFCDNSYEAIKVIKKNLEKTNFVHKSDVLNLDYAVALKKLNKKFDIVFIDAPYAKDYSVIAVNKIMELHLLSNEGIIVLETDDKSKEEELSKNGCIDIYDTRNYGRVILMFIRKG